MDALDKLVRERDRRYTSARGMRATERAAEQKRICIACRRVPDRDRYRTEWLTAHPKPPCPMWCLMRTSPYMTADEHENWHEEVHVSAMMPPFDGLEQCPFCGGRLVEIQW